MSTSRGRPVVALLLPKSERDPVIAELHAGGFNPIPLDGARGDGHDQPAREADRPPGPSAVIAPEHTAPMGPTPHPSVNERVRSEASRTVADSLYRRGGASLNVNDDDLAVGGDQYRHDCDL